MGFASNNFQKKENIQMSLISSFKIFGLHILKTFHFVNNFFIPSQRLKKVFQNNMPRSFDPNHSSAENFKNFSLMQQCQISQY